MPGIDLSTASLQRIHEIEAWGFPQGRKATKAGMEASQMELLPLGLAENRAKHTRILPQMLARIFPLQGPLEWTRLSR